jgi:zinc/manganese transport system substrate-binding protein
MVMWRSLITALIFCVFSPALATPLQVVATFSVLGDMTQRIAGPDAVVRVLVGPESDTHAYQPKPSDARALRTADILIANGLGLETWLDRLTASSDFKGVKVIASSGIDPRLIDTDGTLLPDPHAWGDPKLGRGYIITIADALAKADPAHQAGFRARADAFLAELDLVDQNIKTAFADLVPNQRRVLTSHGAFGYFGAAYKIEFIGLNDLSGENELSAKAMRRLIDAIRQAGVRTVFVESQTDPRLVQQVAAETGAHIGADLLSDNLAKPGAPGDSYIGMFDYNLPILHQAMRELAR